MFSNFATFCADMHAALDSTGLLAADDDEGRDDGDATAGGGGGGAKRGRGSGGRKTTKKAKRGRGGGGGAGGHDPDGVGATLLSANSTDVGARTLTRCTLYVRGHSWLRVRSFLGLRLCPHLCETILR